MADVRRRSALIAIIASSYILLRKYQQNRRVRTHWKKVWMTPTRDAYEGILTELRLTDQFVVCDIPHIGIVIGLDSFPRSNRLVG